MDDDSRAKKLQVMSPRLVANSDFISNLPEEVTDQILVRLSIIDAVRTCVLSTNWRYKWSTITQLVFDDDDDRLILPSPIDRALLIRSGFIHKFELSNRWEPISSSMIDAWILILSRKNIKELVLYFSPSGGSKRYELPSCFFSAQQISSLELEWCVLKKPPPTFTGFSNLKSVYLYDTKTYDGGFEYLISKCPVLERLTLHITYGGLNISSPNLKYLCLSGTLEDICFENTPLLFDVTIRLSHAAVKKFLRSETGNVVKLLRSLPKLGKFEVGGFFLKFSSLSKIPEKLPFTCNHLNNLSVGLYFGAVNAICVTLCLLNSSPNLRELEIIHLYAYSFRNPGRKDIENFWEERALIHWNMSELQIVTITNIKGFNLELEFIKLLLANSPMLEMLIIRSSDFDIHDCKGLEFLQELLIFPRASPKAKIKFLNS